MNTSRPLPPDPNLAPRFLIPCGILSVIVLGLCIARIIGRLRLSPHLHREDYLIGIATILSFSTYIIAGVALLHGSGNPSRYISQENRTIALKCLFAVQICWLLGTALVRISVACSLLRLSGSTVDAEKTWKWSLWVMIGIQVLVYAGTMVLLLFNCYPLRGRWEPVPKVTCWDHKHITRYSWVANTILILMDFVLATMPIQLIRTLNRPRHEKILISGLMALGLLATGIAAYKMTMLVHPPSGDLFATTIKVTLWCKLEEQVGIITACLPSLKSQAERFLRRVGIMKRQAAQFISKPSFVISLNEQGHSPDSRMPSADSLRDMDEVNPNDSDAGSIRR
ncbi:hypothetical protein BKA65DRAFT_403766 [Rhexocercosporidium sp. MPI-PUGE-AT-0058]|nr:hypothetical protein BKA65DRAFT_403766 [Rhexocercosporidium sp. MPI-PUGE-AT-0058]